MAQELAAAFNPAFHVRLVSGGEGLVYRQLQDGQSPWIIVPLRSRQVPQYPEARRKLPSTVATEAESLNYNGLFTWWILLISQ